jgi:2-polyprenyl-3-methyl-5-hydroxy-6-metoxy-1,4-benzoquinol methylase
MPEERMKEAQYQVQLDAYHERGPVRLGLTTSHLWRSDPRHLGFLLSRYKFVAKMLSGRDDVLEIGCGDGFGAHVVLQEVGSVHGVDFDPVFIRMAQEEFATSRLSYEVADLIEGPVQPPREAVYSLDVLEHIDPSAEDAFMRNLLLSVRDPGVAIIGMPSLEGQAYASVWSKEGHVNCKSGTQFKRFLQGYFEQVFLFSMNDEVVHTGFYPMAHYLMALCVTKCNDRETAEGL